MIRKVEQVNLNLFIPTIAGYEVTTMEDACKVARIVVTTTGCKDILSYEQMLQLPDDAIICNIGHFDCEIDTAGLIAKAKERDTIKPQVSSKFIGGIHF